MDSKILIYLELAVRFEESKSKGIHFLLYPEKKKQSQVSWYGIHVIVKMFGQGM